MFEQCEVTAITDNPFKMIGTDWMLITAGTQDRFNTMTASWGGLGVLWERKVCTVYVRPTRYTYEFLEQSGTFTVSFFSEAYRKALLFCGTHSGRDTDKMRETGLTARKGDGYVWFEEARIVLRCRKIYTQDITPDRFLDPSIEQMYPQKDYHRLYIGEITDCLSRRE